MRPLLTLLLLGILTACSNTPRGNEAALPTQPPEALPAEPSPAAPATITQPAAAGQADCPVSLPNGKSPSSKSDADFNLGNADGTLFTIPWSDGKVIFSPNGPGEKHSDGSLEMKWPWYRTVPGDVIIGGRRLDATAPPMTTVTLRGVPDGYGETGFHPSTLVFPSDGCWEVTAKVGESRLTFVTLIVKVSFDAAWPAWLPEGLLYAGADLSRLPQSMELIFDSPRGEAINFETGQELLEDSAPALESARQSIMVQGQPGQCVQDAAGPISLLWSVDGLSYRITHTGPQLSCEDLVRIAGSQP